jgi:Bacterial regulatory protein, Fis family
MEIPLPHAQISNSSRRRLARCLVGSPIKVVERDLILETLAHMHGNKTLAARVLGVSVRTLRNKVSHYCADGRTTTNQPVSAPPSTVGTVGQARMEEGSHASAIPCTEDKAAAMSVALASMRRVAASD